MNNKVSFYSISSTLRRKVLANYYFNNTFQLLAVIFLLSLLLGTVVLLLGNLLDNHQVDQTEGTSGGYLSKIIGLRESEAMIEQRLGPHCVVCDL
jgi:hypothetical protein